MNTRFTDHDRDSNLLESLCESSHLSDKIQRELDSVAEQINHALDEDTSTQQRRLLSFVIPAKDEQATLAILAERILDAVPSEYDVQFVWVDDGSDDQTWQQMQQLVEQLQSNARVSAQALRFRHNVGKAAALTAGFKMAKGDLVFTMDADLQDDPQEIPRFLTAIDSGCDMVTGWKKTRHDPWHKVLPSRVFNWMLSKLTGVKLHDHNCGFKCYRGEVAHVLAPHGELHRMMPTLASIHGYRTTEIEVKHHPREHGQSKYGWERLARGFSDILTMSFLKKYGERPAHFVNKLAALQMLLGVGLAIAALFAEHSMLALTCGGVLIGLATSTFVLGLLTEMTLRDGRMDKRSLPIAEIVNSEHHKTHSQSAEGTVNTDPSLYHIHTDNEKPAGVAVP